MTRPHWARTIATATIRPTTILKKTISPSTITATAIMGAAIMGAVILTTLVGGASAAPAQSCAQNFRMEGVPAMTALTYKTFVVLPGVKPQAALDALARAVAAEGFHNVAVNPGLGAISAVQETSGSGRPQFLRIVVRKNGAGARIDGNFQVQAGQVAHDAVVRTALCGIIAAATD